MVILSILVGIFIVFVEIMRYKLRGSLRFDFASGVSIAFLLAYSFAPITLYLLGPSYDIRFFWINLVNYRDASIGIPAILLGFSGYVSVMVAYTISQKTKLIRDIALLSHVSLLRLRTRDWLRIAMFFGLFSVFCFIMYLERRGAGVITLLEYAAWLRWGIPVEGVRDASWTFLTWSMLSIPAAFVLLGVSMETGSARATRRTSAFAILGALVFLILGATVLWMRAGRLHILNFVLVLLFFIWGRSRSALVRLSAIILALVSITTITLYGKFWLAGFRGVAVPEDPLEQFRAISLELAFPYLSLVNALSESIAYRWFMDYFLAPLYFVGVPLHRIITGEPVPSGVLPESLAAVNTRLIIDPSAPPAIPVDLVTLGYFSAGVVGVLISSIIFGFILGYLEMMLRPATDGVLMILRIYWMVFISTIGVLYADPVNVLNDGLYVILPTVAAVFLGLIKLPHSKV